MLRVLFDTVVYNRMADDADLKRTLQDAVAAGLIVIVETHVQGDQLAATPGERRRTQLKSTQEATGGEQQPTVGIVWDLSRWNRADWADRETDRFYHLVLSNTKRGHKGHAADALLATTALSKADVFVTTDRPLSRRAANAVEEVGGGLEVLMLEQFVERLRVGTA